MGSKFSTFINKLIRMFLRLIPRGAIIPILQGKLRGKKWIVGSGNHGCWLGTYEYKERVLFEKTVKRGNVVFDIGAHAGFYTLLASALTGPSGKVFAFEPLPENLAKLKKHLALNHITNVSVVDAAVFDYCGTADFDTGEGNYRGRVSPRGKLKVKVVCLDELTAKAELPVPDCIKIDVEGGELAVLKGAKDVIKAAHPVIFLSIHSNQAKEQACELLAFSGYAIEWIGSNDARESDTLFARYKEK